MPRANRLHKNCVEQLQKTANTSGQTSLHAFFKQPVVHSPILEGEKSKNDLELVSPNTSGTCGNTADSQVSADLQVAAAKVAEVSAPSIESDASVPTCSDPWIKPRGELTEHERFLSENKGRYCQANWFTDHEWIWYHRDRRAIFCCGCTKYRPSE